MNHFFIAALTFVIFITFGCNSNSNKTSETNTANTASGNNQIKDIT